ncbi:MAG TPA: YidB family protein [Blastocatellia bacterium]|nr:YidB family protein [Blastocatellia bacterium]
MAFIDLLINETTEKFALGKNGIAVLSNVIAILNEPRAGGVEGFLSRFREAGLTDQVNAWLQNETEPPLLPHHLQAVFNETTLYQWMAKTERPLPETLEVIAFVIPRLIGHLAARKALFVTQPEVLRQALWSDEVLRLPDLDEAQINYLPPQQLVPNPISRRLKLRRTLPF